MTDFRLLKEGEVRTRYSPAPTGYFHLGGARTALFNFLFAKKYSGRFILRIEDTDPIRSKKKYEKEIIQGLKWLSLFWDEGPGVGGRFGPYRQSQRKEIYKKYLLKLLNERKAYYCFCTPEEIAQQKEYYIAKGIPYVYPRKCASLLRKKAEEKLKRGEKAVIRLKVPDGEEIKFKDEIRGEIKFKTSLIGDFIIARSLNEPLYNFACAIDDWEMKITHVIRGEDILPNTPYQILIQKALGFKKPIYAHLPLIFGKNKTKLSKRHGARSILEYKKEGYLPEALINFLALLGWNPKDDREIFSLNSLIKEFSLEKVQKSPAIFNPAKLDFLNGFYIRGKSKKEFVSLSLPYLLKKGLIEPKFKEKERIPSLVGFFGKEIKLLYFIKERKEELNFEKLTKILSLYQERIKKLSEIPKLIDFFFKKRLSYKGKLLKWKDMKKEEIEKALKKAVQIFKKIKDNQWTVENLRNILLKESEIFAQEMRKGGDRGYLLWPLRVALTGKKASAPPFEIAEILGKKETLIRIKDALSLLDREKDLT